MYRKKQEQLEKEDNTWQRWQDYFGQHYARLNSSKSLASKLLLQSHKLLEKRFSKVESFSDVIEIGAGDGVHLNYIQHQYDDYYLIDKNLTSLELAQKLYTGFNSKIKLCAQDAGVLAFPTACCDRLIAVHTLEHLYYPHEVLQEWSRVTRKGGIISILIPTDPGIAWRLGRLLQTRSEVLKEGIDYDYVMAREHVNSCHNLVAIIRHLFKRREELWFPFKIASFDINLFYLCHLENT